MVEVIAITGASSGIGRAVALRYVTVKQSKTIALVLISRNVEQLKVVASEIETLSAGKQKVETMILQTDVKDFEQCKIAFNSIIERFGRLDTLILNAGISSHGFFEDIKDPIVFRELMEVNFFGYVNCTMAALPSLKQTKGRLGVVGSLSGEIGLPLRTAYCASKFAVRGFMESLRTELNEEDTSITIVSPGSVRTSMRENAFKSQDVQFSEDEAKRMSPEECANLVVSAVEERKRNVILGFKGQLGTYLQPFFPSLIEKFARKQGAKSKL